MHPNLAWYWQSPGMQLQLRGQAAAPGMAVQGEEGGPWQSFPQECQQQGCMKWHSTKGRRPLKRFENASVTWLSLWLSPICSWRDSGFHSRANRVLQQLKYYTHKTPTAACVRGSAKAQQMRLRSQPQLQKGQKKKKICDIWSKNWGWWWCYAPCSKCHCWLVIYILHVHWAAFLLRASLDDNAFFHMGGSNKIIERN